MAGHSKWHSIRHKKGIADAKRAAVFTKLGRAITVAAKQGGGDPDMNPSLALAISKAKAANMPKDAITKAVDKGTGAGSDLDSFKEVVYEGYAPGGVAAMIVALTDNANRAVAHVRHVFSKTGGNMGDSGAVSYMFDKKGIIELELPSWDEDMEMKIIESGVEDYTELDDRLLQLTTDPKELAHVIKAVEAIEGSTVKDAKLGFVPKSTTELTDEQMEKLATFMDLMEESDDVQEIYSTVKL